MRRFLLSLALLCTCVSLMAARKITGKVSDSMGGLPSASVIIQGTTKGVPTDDNGNFEISVENGDVLEISFMGYSTKTVPITSKTPNVLNISMEEDSQQLEDVIVEVGYGKMRKSDLTGSLSSLGEDAVKYWGPVDWYNGGMEHVTRHLIYSRFWHKFLYDLGVVPNSEPYAKRTAQGLILGPDGEKMSKSKGNVVDPNEVVDQFGADVLRTYVLFMGDYEKAAPWSESSVKGCKRFIDRIWNLLEIAKDGEDYSKELETAFHKTIKKVSEDIENMKFNTAIAALMTLLNDIYDTGSITKGELKTFVKLLDPFAPHVAEEIWAELGGEGLLAVAQWPEYDEAKTVDSTIEVPVQICGKLRATITIAKDSTADEAIAAAKADAKVLEFLDGKNIIKEIYVPGKIINIVAK